MVNVLVDDISDLIHRHVFYSLFQLLLSLARNLFEEQMSLERLVGTIITEAKEMLKCQRCTVYLLDLKMYEQVRVSPYRYCIENQSCLFETKFLNFQMDSDNFLIGFSGGGGGGVNSGGGRQLTQAMRGHTPLNNRTSINTDGSQFSSASSLSRIEVRYHTAILNGMR